MSVVLSGVNSAAIFQSFGGAFLRADVLWIGRLID
jgi:hypothetical protein